MHELNAAIDEASRWGRERDSDRKRLVELLAQAEEGLKRAVAVWEDYLASPPQVEERFAFMKMVGPDRAKKLHELHLRVTDCVREILYAVGGTHAYYGGILDGLVEEAYRQLRANETAEDRAEQAVNTMKERIARLRALRERLQGDGRRSAAAG